MGILISMREGSSKELESLYDWLRADVEIAATVGQRKQPPREGEMGSMVDALIVAVGSGGAITVLASLLKAWVLQPRHAGVRLHLENHPNGKRIMEVDADRMRTEDINALFAELRKLNES
jgi:hypothetical protein